MQERQTKQKQIIYEALQTLDHPTATEVYGYVRETNPSVSRATVFRVLNGFAGNGRALELRIAGNEVRYDYNVSPHFHAHCTTCGRVADVECNDLPYPPLQVKSEDFEVEGYSIEFFGTCHACKQFWATKNAEEEKKS